MTIDEAIEGLWGCTLDLCKETYEWTGNDMGNSKPNISYKNYLVNNPIEIHIGGCDAYDLPPGTGNTQVQIPESYSAEYNSYSIGSLSRYALPNNVAQCLTALRSIGLPEAICKALTACMVQECACNPRVVNTWERDGKSPNISTHGWSNAGEGAVGFTFWNIKQKLIGRLNSDPRAHQKLPTTEAGYIKGPHICDLDFHDQMLMLSYFYDNTIRKLGSSVDATVAAAEFFLDKAGRGFGKGETIFDKAYAAGAKYQKFNKRKHNCFLDILKYMEQI